MSAPDPAWYFIILKFECTMENNNGLPGSNKPSFLVTNGAKIVTDDILLGILYPCSPTV